MIGQIRIGKLSLDLELRDAFIHGRPARLSEKEFSLLLHLAARLGEVLAPELLFEQVWGFDAELGPRTLDVTIRRIRCKIELDPDQPRYLQTAEGGYVVVVPADDTG